MEKLMEQCLVGPISKGDCENVKKLLIKGAGANMVINFKVISIIANGIKEKGVREESVIVNKTSKEKGDTPIKKQFYMFI